jgi:hypothetical protein
VPYPLTIEDKLRNYVIGHAELGLDLQPIFEHFSVHLPAETVATVAAEALWGVSPGATLPRNRGKKDTVPSSKTPVPTEELKSPRKKLDHAGVRDAPTGKFEKTSTRLISCICPTFGRPSTYQYLVEEAIESFLRQDYPNKELLVLNDCADQVLVCDAPGVRVINVRHRFESLGEKYNAAVRLAHGELLAPWEDDDISLPWRLSLSVERLGDAAYFNPRCYWFWDSDGLHFNHTMGWGHNLSLFTRSAFDAVGGYPEISGPQDAEMDSALRSKVVCVQPGANGQRPLSKSEWYYIYRWGVHPWHLSSRLPYEDFYHEIGTLAVETGRFELTPHWEKDYELATRRLLASD